jgi:DnaK suppressor protein
MIEESDIKAFQLKLEERRAEILTGKEAMKQENAPLELDQARVGRLSRMDAMQQKAMSQAGARLLDLELQRIRTALGRIESEEFGYCILCDEEIAEKRLEFDPSLLTCIRCAEKAERG